MSPFSMAVKGKNRKNVNSVCMGSVCQLIGFILGTWAGSCLLCRRSVPLNIRTSKFFTMFVSSLYWKPKFSSNNLCFLTPLIYRSIWNNFLFSLAIWHLWIFCLCVGISLPYKSLFSQVSWLPRCRLWTRLNQWEAFMPNLRSEVWDMEEQMSSEELRGSRHWGFSHNTQCLGVVAGLSFLEQFTWDFGWDS